MRLPHQFTHLDPAVRREIVDHEASDGYPLSGVLYRPPGRRYLVIYRTLADPRYLDPTLDPSPRPLGSVFSFGRDPIAGNYGEGLARAMSARGWLSTWSGLSSHAALERTLPAVRVPTLVISAASDTDIYPAECRRQLAAAGATDKEYYEQDGADHYFRPLGTGDADPRDRLADACVLPWLRARFTA